LRSVYTPRRGPDNGGLCCKTRKCGLSKIPAKVSPSSVSARDAFLKRIGRPPVESVQIDVVPRVRKHRALQRPLENSLSQNTIEPRTDPCTAANSTAIQSVRQRGRRAAWEVSADRRAKSWHCGGTHPRLRQRRV